MGTPPLASPTGGALVLGGAGFIGTHLVADLVERGYPRIIVADLERPSSFMPGVEYRKCDVRDPIALDVAGIETIFNLAGLVATPGHPDAEYLRTNVRGAINTCELASRSEANTIVFTSTMSVYPTGDDLKTEESPVDPVNAYGESKVIAESIHEQWQQSASANRLKVVRPAVVFGPGERGNFARLLRLIRSGRFVYPGRRDTIKACGFVTDLVRSMHWALSNTSPRLLFNFAFPERTTIQRISEAIALETGSRNPRYTIPARAMMEAARPFEWLELAGLRTGVNRVRIQKLIESTNIYPDYLLKNGFVWDTDLDEAIRRWVAADSQGQ
jgi:nucleoside-diphosphate-sugar epimerase